MNPYSILNQVDPSPPQLRAVTSRGADTVVVAGAGAGKTRALVARYLALLEDDIPLRRIVAITFTLKAAREMRNRVRDEMVRFAARDELPSELRERWQAQAGASDAARISTIHSLCTEILRSHPAEAGVDPRFSVLQPADAAHLRQSVLDDSMSWAADDPASLGLFELLGVSGLRAVLDHLLDRRLDAAGTPEYTAGDVLGHWQGVLAVRQSAALAALLQQGRWRRAAKVVREPTGAPRTNGMEEQRRVAVAALDGAAAAGLGEQLQCLKPLGSITINRGSCREFSGGRSAFDELKEALRTLRELWTGSTILALEIGPLDEMAAAAVPALLALAGRAAARYAGVKRDRQSLDFDDLEGGALGLLETQPAVRERWQREVLALLVDEYQDTNVRQSKLVRLLAPPAAKKLFIVGDAKQSIYGFRGADVTVFRREQDQIRSALGCCVSLDDSYRAHEALLAAVNALMRRILGDAGDPARPWRAPFEALAPRRAEPSPGFSPPHVELLLAAGTKAGGALQSAARLLAARLAALVDGGACRVVEGYQVRALNWGDVAVLCRAASSFGAYEAAFEEAGIPFLTVAGSGFYERPEVRDVLNALRALADPNDDLALAGLLRSPACGLSDPDLFRLVELRQETKAPNLWAALQSAAPAFPGEAARRVEWVTACIRSLSAEAGRLTVAALLKDFLDRTGYQAALVAAGQRRAARNIDKLLADATASRLVAAGDFLEYVRGVQNAGIHEGEARGSAEGAAQIMSVHAAKGLEFPIVVIGDAAYEGASRSPAVILDAELGPALLVRDPAGARCAVYELAKLDQADREAAESERLLYVAATRARERLILSGHVTLGRDGALKARGWLGRVVGEGCLGVGCDGDTVDGRLVAPFTQDLLLDGCPVRCEIVPDCPPPWRNVRRDLAPAAAPEPCPLPPPLLAAVAPPPEARPPSEEEGKRRPAHPEWRVVPVAGDDSAAPATHRIAGTLFHEAIAAWRFTGPGFEAWAEARGREHGLIDRDQLSRAVGRAALLLDRFAGSTLCAEMASAARRLHEVPYQTLAGGRPENGIIDALYLPPAEGSWVLVEFKTDSIPAGAGPRPWLAERGYLDQAGRYVAAVRQWTGARPRCLICLLDHGGTLRLEELEPRA